MHVLPSRKPSSIRFPGIGRQPRIIRKAGVYSLAGQPQYVSRIRPLYAAIRRRQDTPPWEGRGLAKGSADTVPKGKAIPSKQW